MKPPRFVQHVHTKGDFFPLFCLCDICFFHFAYTKKTFADFAAAAQRTATARGGNDVGHEGPDMGGAPSHIFLRGSAVCPGRHAQGFLYQIREKRPRSWRRPHVCVHFVHIPTDVRFLRSFNRLTRYSRRFVAKLAIDQRSMYNVDQYERDVKMQVASPPSARLSQRLQCCLLPSFSSCPSTTSGSLLRGRWPRFTTKTYRRRHASLFLHLVLTSKQKIFI